jgi:hypothetical protein
MARFRVSGDHWALARDDRFAKSLTSVSGAWRSGRPGAVRARISAKSRVGEPLGRFARRIDGRLP